MHKNTFFLVIVLSVIAALLVGFNIGRKMNPNQLTQEELPQTIVVTPTAIPEPSRFTSTICGITVTLPTGTTGQALATNSARFVSSDGSQVIFGCDKDVPRIPVPTGSMEKIKVASISATLYHSQSAKDGTLQDALIFTHPDNGMDIVLSGYGATFSAIIHSIELVQ